MLWKDGKCYDIELIAELVEMHKDPSPEPAYWAFILQLGGDGVAGVATFVMARDWSGPIGSGKAVIEWGSADRDIITFHLPVHEVIPLLEAYDEGEEGWDEVRARIESVTAHAIAEVLERDGLKVLVSE